MCDIDGVLLKWIPEYTGKQRQKPLPGIEKLKFWFNEGHTIILTTGRSELYRIQTTKQLNRLGIYYHQLIMDLPRGQRILINDSKPYEGWEGIETAIGITVERDKGLDSIDEI